MRVSIAASALFVARRAEHITMIRLGLRQSRHNGCLARGAVVLAELV